MTDSVGRKGPVSVPPKVTGSAATPTKEVSNASEVSAVGKAGVSNLRPVTRMLSASERAQLLQLVDDEASRVFGDEKSQTKRQRKATTAVKMALEAGMIQEEES